MEKKKEWAKHWRRDSEVQGVEDKPERNHLEEGLPKLVEDNLESSEELQGDHGCGL